MIEKTKGGTLISQIQQVNSRIWNRLLRENGLGELEGARGRVIFALWGKEGLTNKELCEATSLDKSTMTGIISRLERDGYITKRIVETDKRTVLISLVERNYDFMEKLPYVSKQMNEIFYRTFSDEEIVCFEEQLERILQNCKIAEL